MRRPSGRVLSWLVAAVLAAPVLVWALPAGAATVSCRATWGSLPKQAGTNVTAALTSVTAGRHPCYDRLVFTLDGPAGGYNVRYVPEVLTEGRGLPLSLRGGAFLQVTLLAPAQDLHGAPTYNPPLAAEAVPVGSLQTLRQVAFAGSFEGYTSFGVGVRGRVPFRVLVLAGPGSGGRVVLDVAHRW